MRPEKFFSRAHHHLIFFKKKLAWPQIYAQQATIYTYAETGNRNDCKKKKEPILL